MTDAQRTAIAKDLPRAEPELIGAAMLDIRDCHRLEIQVALYEHETAGLRYETWPSEAQRLIERSLTDWRARHPERELRSITTAAVKRDGLLHCVMIVHHGLRP
jgi:hypothetical protein